LATISKCSMISIHFRIKPCAERLVSSLPRVVAHRQGAHPGDSNGTKGHIVLGEGGGGFGDGERDMQIHGNTPVMSWRYCRGVAWGLEGRGEGVQLCNSTPGTFPE
jgi:hypothetical protein